MDDELPEAQWSGDPVLAEEARQLPAKLHQQAQQQLQQQYSTESRGCLLTLAVGVAIVGPFLAILFLMGGDLVPVFATVVGSCALAGLLLAAVSRGIRGALAVLGLPLIWLVSFVGLELWSGIRSVPSTDETLYLGVFLLIQAASAEAGYLIGRLRRRSPETNVSTIGEISGLPRT